MTIIYHIIYAVLYTFSLLPFRVMYLLSDLMYFFVRHVVKYRKKVIEKNLKSSFPEKTGAELQQIEREFYHFLCDYLVETVKLLTISEKELRKRMKFTHVEPFVQCLDSGQSAALYLGHQCNWEWITSIPYWLPENVLSTTIYHPLENKIADKLFKTIREKHHAHGMTMQNSLREIIKYKQEQQTIIVGLLADQVPLWQNIHHWINFLHQETPVLTGSERIIKHVGLAVFYGEMRREKRGHYVCDIQQITTNPDKTENFSITDKYFELLEKSIRRQPAFWLWSHNRWKRTRQDFDKYFYVKDGKVIKK